MFWEEFKQKVVENTTGSDIAESVLEKLSSSQINPLALLKPGYYLGNLAVLTMDYIGYVEQLLQVRDGDKPALLEKTILIRECGKTIAYSLKETLDPLEIAIQHIEEAYEGYEEETLEDIEDAELAEMEEEEYDEKSESEEHDHEKEDETSEEEDYRDDFNEQKEALRQELEVKLRTSDCGELTVKNLAQKISELYLEGVMLNRDLGKISETAEGDLVEMLSILVDIQYSLDEKLRALLLEDYLTEDPLFSPGLPTVCAQFMNEITESMMESE